MVICNIVHKLSDSNKEVDKTLITKYEQCPVVNVVRSIKDVDSSIPTILYGYKTATEMLMGDVPRGTQRIKKNLYWTYSYTEIPHEVWLDKFVAGVIDEFFWHKDHGIDPIFLTFDMGGFVQDLNPWPIVHAGDHEIYVVEKRDVYGEIVAHSIKKESLDYLGTDPDAFLSDLYAKLGYKCLGIESQRTDLITKPSPLFIDDLLYADTGIWEGVEEVCAKFRPLKTLTRKEVLVYYLRQSLRLRDSFPKYR